MATKKRKTRKAPSKAPERKPPKAKARVPAKAKKPTKKTRAVKAPKAKKPATKKPATKKPATKKPAAKKPTKKAPAVKAKKPAKKPASTRILPTKAKPARKGKTPKKPTKQAPPKAPRKPSKAPTKKPATKKPVKRKKGAKKPRTRLEGTTSVDRVREGLKSVAARLGLDGESIRSQTYKTGDVDMELRFIAPSRKALTGFFIRLENAIDALEWPSRTWFGAMLLGTYDPGKDGSFGAYGKRLGMEVIEVYPQRRVNVHYQLLTARRIAHNLMRRQKTLQIVLRTYVGDERPNRRFVK